jgi:hypothetical protein
MTPPTYLLAKFIPDLQRMEPRNIGVILWTPERTAARFLFEKSPGKVDGRAVPDWIGNLGAYKQWIAYWRESVSAPDYTPATGGPAVDLRSPEFLQAIQSANRGQYVLVKGGVLLDGLPLEEVGAACQHLFETLVGERASEEKRELTLDERWEDILDRMQIRRHPLYRRDYSVAAGTDTLIFSDAIANGVPSQLFERVALANRPATFMKNVHHAAWQFEKVVERGVIAAENTAAIVSMTPEQEAEHEGLVATLRSVTPVINVRREDALVPVEQKMAAFTLPQTWVSHVNWKDDFLKGLEKPIHRFPRQVEPPQLGWKKE